MLINQRFFQVLKLSQDYFLRLELILALDSVRVIPAHLRFNENLIKLIQIHRGIRMLLLGARYRFLNFWRPSPFPFADFVLQIGQEVIKKAFFAHISELRLLKLPRV